MRRVHGPAPAALAAATLALAAAPAGAQRAGPHPVTLEGRGDVVGGSPLLLAGVGAFVDAGLNVRLGATLGAGVSASGGGAVAEGALVGRFLLDPLRQARRGVYVGGGLGGRVGAAGRRAFVVALVGVEGRGGGAVAPAVEAGVGGGVRVAVVLRRGRAGRR